MNKGNWNNTGETGTVGVVVVGHKQIDKQGKFVLEKQQVMLDVVDRLEESWRKENIENFGCGKNLRLLYI